MVDLLFEQPGQVFIFRRKMTLAHDPACPLSGGIEDQQAPAAIIPADLRACQVDGTVPLRGCPVIPEKRAGLGAFRKNMPVTKEGNLIRVNSYCGFFPRVLVFYKEPVITVIFLDGMDKSEMTAA
jgi:hypothetical protein